MNVKEDFEKKGDGEQEWRDRQTATGRERERSEEGNKWIKLRIHDNGKNEDWG